MCSKKLGKSILSHCQPCDAAKALLSKDMARQARILVQSYIDSRSR